MPLAASRALVSLAEGGNPTGTVAVVDIGANTTDISIFRDGRITFYHYDPYAQALSKLERAHAQDLADVASMLEAGLITRDRLAVLFAEIEPELFRYPAVDPRALRMRVEELVGRAC